MRRILLVLSVTALMAVMMVAMAAPAFARAYGNSENDYNSGNGNGHLHGGDIYNVNSHGKSHSDWGDAHA
jgi:hypothetical protein